MSRIKPTQRIYDVEARLGVAFKLFDEGVGNER